MSTLEAFFKAAKSIVTIGSKTNAENRQKIRDVVGQLGDELDRALMLADSYLAGIRYSINDQDLMQYLGNARFKLQQGFSEHHVCAGLYRLGDEFNQLFDPVKFSVSINSFTEIPELINRLKDGERAVIDDLDQVILKLNNFSMQLSGATPDLIVAIKEDINKEVAKDRQSLEKLRNKIKVLRRRITDEL